ncbi:MAG TPA: TM2 domain-containing protein [Paenalcaligenes sp.]|nr:TM2 domain-containing protein [Paenalcaligenes sp.]
MFRVIGLAIVIFVALLFALSMGEDVGRFVTHHMGHLFDVIWAFLRLIGNQIQQFFAQLWGFLQGNRLKVLIALALTGPITYWLVRQRTQGNQKDNGPNKKTAIALAVLLGWLGAHRFYLSQIGWGTLFLVCCYVFPPLALFLGWIDALRYALMDQEEFTHLYIHQQALQNNSIPPKK